MLFAPNNSLVHYYVNCKKNDQYQNKITKVLANLEGRIIQGYIFPWNDEKAVKTENFSLLKDYASYSFPTDFIKMYNYISQTYIYPLSSIFETVINNRKKIKLPKREVNFYLKIKSLNFNFPRKYKDIVDFLFQNGDTKYSVLSKYFSKRRINNFLKATAYLGKYYIGIGDLSYLSLKDLVFKISRIADLKLRLFIFPSLSLAQEIYEEILKIISIKEGLTKRKRENNILKSSIIQVLENTYFALPTALLMPLTWDEIIFVDAESELYKLSIPPYFDSLDIAKKFFSNSILHFRAPTFKLYSFYNIPLFHKHHLKFSFEKCNGNFYSILKDHFDGKTLILVKNTAYSSRIKCRHCGTLMKCPKCGHFLSYYKNLDLYSCSHCGYFSKTIKCSECGSKFFNYSFFGAEYFKEEIKKVFPDVSIFDFFNKNLSALHSKCVIATTSIFYHYINTYFDRIIVQNIDSFVFMDYKARDRILTLISKLQTFLKDGGELKIFYDSNLFELAFPLEIKKYYDIERRERQYFKFPPYYFIVYVYFDTTQLKLDYLFGKLILFLREYKAEDYEVFKKEEFGKGLLTIKIREKDIKLLKIFLNSYKENIFIYVNPRKEI